MAFTFKQFHIDDLNCGMPVSTDGVILGAWAPLAEAKNILDIGAGSGLLSLMAAQRSQGQITAVELEEKAAAACRYNMTQSPWAKRCQLVHGDIQSVCQLAQYQGYFDHIICNPPYFEHGPKASEQHRAMARHTETLGFTPLLDAISQCLSFEGYASLILPIQSLARFKACLNDTALYLVREVWVKSVENKAANRALLLLSKTEVEPYQRTDLTIRGEDGNYTEQMIELTKDFYLKL
ncbi:methyltransferase small [Shewanella sp. MR-4]|uniref:tRNA1(Val) (adenine(37)-N6)-methyltransferase n=1 Tax=Shewanella sp. (strain MR-4) TaxID=60480 RepID=TRMN6_SHESM|nr:methyltransferase [Shewanella sp. MR-4]Q0HM44.1 RecName: Full=tRNA1(Val) (adenine(37)-N6)-methyltransferase; AltName: Full=tRNA m6A37 methyltransferase [Shewanella sp. MR-4]ABI37873.1 methyltransferase small [Shewanella sp. MR-4]